MNAWWEARQPRERTLLLAMAVAIAAFVYTYGLVAPLRHLRDAAREAYDRSAADAIAVHAGVAAIEAARRTGPVPPGANGIDDAVLASAAATGVAISRHGTGGDATLAVGIDTVDAPHLFAWLDALRRDHGLSPQTLDARAHAGALQVEATFARDAP